MVEEGELNVSELEVLWGVMMEGMILVGREIEEYRGNRVEGELVYVDCVEGGKEMCMYMKWGGGWVYGGVGI